MLFSSLRVGPLKAMLFSTRKGSNPAAERIEGLNMPVWGVAGGMVGCGVMGCRTSDRKVRSAWVLLVAVLLKRLAWLANLRSSLTCFLVF